MDKLQEVFTNAVEQKLNDGTIERIVSEQLTDAIKSIVNNEFGWSGNSRKALQEKLEPLCLKAVANAKLDETIILLQEIIDTGLKSPDARLADISRTIKGIYTAEKLGSDIQFNQTVKLSDIFKAYVQQIEENTYSENDIEDAGLELTCEDCMGAYVDIEMEVNKLSNNLISIELKNEIEKDKDIKFKLHKMSEQSFYTIDYSIGQMPINNLYCADTFILYLLTLKHNYCQIEVNTDSEQETIWCEVNEY